MKRFMTALLVFVLTVTTVLPLAGCGKKTENVISWGQWLAMVDSAFGMESYTTEIPYFNTVSETDPYFKEVQIAAEWNVIPSGIQLDTKKNVKWQEALVTLINVGNFMDADATEEEKVTYAKENFGVEIRDYWLSREITIEKATLLLSNAQEQWANRKYDYMTQEISFKEGIKDFTTQENYISEYTLLEDNVIAIPKEHAGEIEQGDVYVLPPTSGVPGISTYKAEEITEDENYVYVKNSETLGLEEVAENLFVEGTYVPTAENSIIYDGNGNIISSGSNVATYLGTEEGKEYQISNLIVQNETDNKGINTKISNKHSFVVDGWSVDLEYGLDGSLNLKASVKTPNMLSSDDATLKGNASFEVSDFTITQKIDWKWFQLKEASLKVDYKETAKLGFEYKPKEIKQVFAPEWSNGNGKFLTNWKKSVWKDNDAKGAKTIKICSIDVYDCAVARVCLDINATLRANGSVSITVTERGTKGAEYKDGNFRFINTSDRTGELTAKGKVELTAALGPALYVIGLKEQIIGIQVEGGVGATVSFTYRLADSENHLLEEEIESDGNGEQDESLYSASISAKGSEIEEFAKTQGCDGYVVNQDTVILHIDACIDVTGYFIIRVKMPDTCMAAKLLKGKITLSHEFLGESNAKFINIHYENGQLVGMKLGLGVDSQCTKKYVPFEANTQATASPLPEESIAESETAWVGENLLIGQMKTTIAIGEVSSVFVQQLPKGYAEKDIVYKSDDEKVATINENGVITGISEGSVVITVMTSDEKYKACVAVTVTKDEEITITPLKWKTDTSKLIEL